MTVSMNLHDCAPKKSGRRGRSPNKAQKHGKGETTRQRRSPDTRASIWSSTPSCLDRNKMADGKLKRRNAARMTIPAVKPDHGHPITLIMLNHAQQKLRVKKPILPAS